MELSQKNFVKKMHLPPYVVGLDKMLVIYIYTYDINRTARELKNYATDMFVRV